MNRGNIHLAASMAGDERHVYRYSRKLKRWVPTWETIRSELRKKWGAPRKADRCAMCDTPKRFRARSHATTTPACRRTPVVRVPCFVFGRLGLDALCEAHAKRELVDNEAFLFSGCTATEAQLWRLAPTPLTKPGGRATPFSQRRAR